MNLNRLLLRGAWAPIIEQDIWYLLKSSRKSKKSLSLALFENRITVLDNWKLQCEWGISFPDWTRDIRFDKSVRYGTVLPLPDNRLNSNIRQQYYKST